MAITFKDITAQDMAQTRAEFLETLSRNLAPITAESEIIRITLESIGNVLDSDSCYFVECLKEKTYLL